METSNSNGPNSTGSGLFEPVLIFMSLIIVLITLRIVATFLGIPWSEYSTYYYWAYALVIFYYLLPEIPQYF